MKACAYLLGASALAFAWCGTAAAQTAPASQGQTTADAANSRARKTFRLTAAGRALPTMPPRAGRYRGPRGGDPPAASPALRDRD